ncbi:cytochrome P450 [Nocardia sp. NBC_01499]|uniref:hypothetical protein n=1 Tax=Nocardia sp. NBC_01499 TaxID=2903597 RepID=UPI0038692994
MTDTTTHRRCPAHIPGDIARHADDDFHSVYTHLRHDHPVYHDSDLELWVVSRHDDIAEVLRDREHAYTPAHSYDPIQPMDPEASRIYTAVHDVPVAASTDPPIHTRYRNALTAVWPTSATRLAPWQPRIESRAREAAEAFAARPDRFGELFADYVQPLTMRVMSDLIGVTPHEEQCVIDGSSGMSDLLWSFQQPIDQRRCAQAVVEQWKLCTDLVSRYRADPQANLTTAWTTYRDADGTPLTDAEIASTLMEVLTTNTETLALLITTALRHLLTGDGYRHLTHHPERACTAIEETLRVDPPLIGWLRTTRHPVTLAGVELPRDARLLLLMHSGARDEVHGTAEPHSFDYQRDDIPPTLVFGAGDHYCPGALYTRFVAQHALTALAEALPNLTLTAEAPAPRLANLLLRRATRLTVTW